MTGNLVLLVEDDEDDLLLMRRAFARVAPECTLEVCRDGEEARTRLEAAVHDSARPAVVLMDLKLPRLNGHELLAWKQGQAGLAAVPVVVVSSSDRVEDVAQAWANGAASYVVKPGSPTERRQLVERVAGWWLGTNITG